MKTPDPQNTAGMRAERECAYHLPAEWEPHAATWIGWPQLASDWSGKMAVIPWVFAEIVRCIAPGEAVSIVVAPKRRQRAADLLRRAGADLARVRWFEIPTIRNWMRDAGPIFLRRDGDCDVVIADFKFNAWARYTNWRRDDAMASTVAAALGIDVVTPRHRKRRVVLEGGAIDVNGRGTLIATEECLLDQQVQVRNPGFTREDVEAVFREYLGITRTIWLGRGIAGDDTHGHVDDLCRFVSPDTVLLCRCDDARDENYRPLAENRERLEGARLANGSRLHVIPLPMPEPVVFEGRRLPASYANFYIANHAVLVPTFNCPGDRVALGTIAECFPTRRVTGIHAGDLILGRGAVHCLTQQQPAERDKSARWEQDCGRGP